MLKWRFPMEETERPVSSFRVRRAGIDCQRRSRGHTELARKCRELQATADAQAGFIRALLCDKERSMSLLEKVMEEFSRLEKQIAMAEKEITVEKETNHTLKSEIENWKTECANLELCANMLQAELCRLRPSTNARNTHMVVTKPQILQSLRDENGLTVSDRPINYRGSQDITYQNMENESRLESQMNSRSSNTPPAEYRQQVTCSVHVSNSETANVTVLTKCLCFWTVTSEDQNKSKIDSKSREKGILKRMFGRLKRSKKNGNAC